MSKFELVDNLNIENALIKVIGVGGGGGNAVCHMLRSQLKGVEFICANTDAQALTKQHQEAHTHIQLGSSITRGLGAGANPQVGKQAAEEDKERIAELLKGSDMVFLTAGMGGGTGTGAAPVVAQIAKDLGALTVAVVTKPFEFEGKNRMKVAQEGIIELQQYVDSLIIIPNEKLLPVLGRDVSLLNAFGAVNDVLLGAVQGISELIIRSGLINVDFADVRTVMSEMGMAMMGTGLATGANRAIEAAEKALKSPLLEDVNIQGARGVLVNITAGPDLSVGEYHEVGDRVREFASDSAQIVVGTVIDPDMVDEFRVTVVATGLCSYPTSDKVTEIKSYKKPDGRLDLSALEVPAYHRSLGHRSYESASVTPIPNQAQNNSKKTLDKEAENDKLSHTNISSTMKVDKNNIDYLDIPAFLRRQIK